MSPIGFDPDRNRQIAELAKTSVGNELPKVEAKPNNNNNVEDTANSGNIDEPAATLEELTPTSKHDFQQTVSFPDIGAHPIGSTPVKFHPRPHFTPNEERKNLRLGVENQALRIFEAFQNALDRQENG